MKYIVLIILLCFILIGTVNAEMVIFTVDETSWLYNSANGYWTFFVSTTNNSMYYMIIEDPIFGSSFAEHCSMICRLYSQYAPNTTHTVNISDYCIME